MATKTPAFIVGSDGTPGTAGHTPIANGTVYMPLVGSSATGQYNGTQAAVISPIPLAGTLSHFTARVSGAISAGSYVITLQMGSGTTAPSDDVNSPSVTLNSSTQQATDSVNTETFADGDHACLKIVTTAITGGGTLTFSFLFTSSATGETFLFFGHSAGATSQAAGFVPIGGYNAVAADSNGIQFPSPTSFTATGMRVYSQTTPGAGTTRTYTLRKNGADTALTAGISDANQHGSGTASVAVAADDLLNIALTVTGTPAASIVRGAIRIVMDTDGESILPSTASGNQNATMYMSASGRATTGETTESDTHCVAPFAFDWKKLYVKISAVTGASSRSRGATARKGGADQSLTAGISTNGPTTANDTSNTVSVAAGDLIDWYAYRTGSPGAATISLGSVAYITPPSGGGGAANYLLLLGV